MFVDITNTENKYAIIYADPPWKYGGDGGKKWRPASEYYPTMSFKELKDLGPVVKNISEDDSLLFMWAVSSELKRCIEVGESWGFKYITVAFVWYKERANVGNYTMSGCELCLLFKRGKIPKDRVRNPGQKQFFSAPVSVHSKKPIEIAERISKMYPESRKIELFARDSKPGYDNWGDETDKFSGGPPHD